MSYVSSATETDKAEFQTRGIDLSLEPASQQPMLGEKALVQIANLSTKTEKAAKAHFGVFVPEQQLAVVGNVF